MMREVPRHPKFEAFRDGLVGLVPGISKRADHELYHVLAVGYLEQLWLFAAEFTPEGNVGKYPLERVEAALRWTGRPTLLMQLLVRTGWLDATSDDPRGKKVEFVAGSPMPSCMIHDWNDHNTQATRRRIERIVQKRENGSHINQSDSEKMACLPDHTKPDQTKPNQTACAAADVDARAGPKFADEPFRSRSPYGRGALELNGLRSQRFDDWWSKWSAVRGTNRKTEAADAYTDVVMADVEKDCFDCTESYLGGPGADVTRGYNPENFLRKQAVDRFKARWPSTRVQPKIEQGGYDLFPRFERPK